jgi:predicted dehydrogenase
MNQAIHLVDLLYWHLGEVAEIQSVTGTFAHQIEVEDTAAAVLRMRSGAVATFVGTTTFQTEHCFYPPYGGGSLTRVEINGPRGSISVVDDELREAVLDGGRELPPPEQPPNVLADVVAALADSGYRSPTLVRGAEARKSVEIVDALYRAAATGAPVTVGAPEQAPGSAVPASPAAPAGS